MNFNPPITTSAQLCKSHLIKTYLFPSNHTSKPTAARNAHVWAFSTHFCMDVGFDFFGGFRTNALKCVIYWSRAGAVFARCCPLFFALINSSERFVGFYPINYVIIYSRQSTILKVGRKGEQMWARTLRYFAHYRRWAVAAGPTRNEWPKVIAKGDFCHIIRRGKSEPKSA